MKKTFNLQIEKKNPDRLIEAVKNEVRSYMKRERRKLLPEGAVFWEFECRFGQTDETAAAVTTSGIITALDKAHAAQWEQCFVAIHAKPSFKVRAVSVEEAPVSSNEEEKVLTQPQTTMLSSEEAPHQPR